MNYSAAKDIAVKICYSLQPFCDKINIAGSVRRLKPEVKDIEVICLPKMKELPSIDLFDDTKTFYSPDAGFIVKAAHLGKILKGNPHGKYCQIELPEGINLDLFMPDSFDYYRQYAIRTGSADYAARVIATGWRKIGWCGSDRGLRLMADCIESKGPDGKSKWKCINQNTELPPVWQSEEEFFQWIKVPLIKPSQRI